MAIYLPELKDDFPQQRLLLLLVFGHAGELAGFIIWENEDAPGVSFVVGGVAGCSFGEKLDGKASMSAKSISISGSSV